MTQTVFEVTVTKWVDAEGLEKQEIGRLLLMGGDASASRQSFTYRLDENAHPLVPRPLRHRGHVKNYPIRQSVWGLVHEAVEQALFHCCRSS